MSKRKIPPDDHIKASVQLIELQVAVIEHCKALREMTDLLLREKPEAAVARLDGAVTVLERAVGKHYREGKIRVRREEIRRGKKGNGNK